MSRIYIHMQIRIFSANLFEITLVSLLNEQALINKQGGVFQKFDKRAGSNNQAGRNFHSIIINEQALINKQVEIIHKF